MLKSGVVFIGEPSIQLHELLCLAMYLEIPLALSDPISFEIAKKFSDIIPVYQISKDFTLKFFTSSLNKLYTNLSPDELDFIPSADLKKFEIMHIVKDGFVLYKNSKNNSFFSSFYHTKQFIPLESNWVNLGAIGALSYRKHKKQLQKILAGCIPEIGDCRYCVTQILQHTEKSKLTKEETLDQIEFINFAFSGFDASFKTGIIPAHGLIDAAIDTTSACIIQDEPLSLLALNHKRPILIKAPIKGFYEELSPLTSLLPKESKNIAPLIENYFEFETINREDLIKESTRKFFNKSLF